MTLTVTDNKGASGQRHPPGHGHRPARAARRLRRGRRRRPTRGSTGASVRRAAPSRPTLSGGLSAGTLLQRRTPWAGPARCRQPNTAVRFNGTNGFVVLRRSPSPTRRCTPRRPGSRPPPPRAARSSASAATATGSSPSYDRHVYMQDDGKLVFGTWTGADEHDHHRRRPTTTAQWHHVVATQSGDGMKLYVDGQLVGTNPQTQAEGYTGYWKVGGDNTWGSSSSRTSTAPSTRSRCTSRSSARAGSRRTTPRRPRRPNQPPTAQFTRRPTDLAVSVDAVDSTDADGDVTSLRVGASVTAGPAPARPPSHTYATAGTYTVKLTVTDNDGATDTVEHDVTVTAANVVPTADVHADGRTSTSPSTPPTPTIPTATSSRTRGTSVTARRARRDRRAHLRRGRHLRGDADRDRRPRRAPAPLTKEVTATEPPNLDSDGRVHLDHERVAGQLRRRRRPPTPTATVSSYDWKFGTRARHGQDGVVHLPLGRDRTRSS